MADAAEEAAAGSNEDEDTSAENSPKDGEEDDAAVGEDSAQDGDEEVRYALFDFECKEVQSMSMTHAFRVAR